MEQLSFQGRGGTSRGAFAPIDATQAALQASQQGIQNAAALNQNAQQSAVANVGQILQGVLQRAQGQQGGQQAGQLGLDISNPSGFQNAPEQPQVPSQPQGVPMSPTGAFAQRAATPTAPNAGTAGNISPSGPASPTGQLARKFGAFQPAENPTPQSVPPVQNNSVVPQQGAFGQAESMANGQSGQTINATGQNPRPQGAFGNPAGDLIEGASQAIGAAGGPGPSNLTNQQIATMTQNMLPELGLEGIDLSSIGDGSPESNAIIEKAKSLANRIHGGTAAIDAQQAANPMGLDILRQGGFGTLIDQTKKRGAFM